MLRRRAERRALVTVLFTDIVASTETAARLGDRRWREVVKSHHAAVRSALRAHRGREVDTAGDGFFAIFREPGEAIHCAVAVREAVAALGLQIRAGIHTGEVEPMGEKVGGLAVVIAARVLATCEPGQIRVTSTLRDLVTGSGLAFTDAGTHPLKGVPGEWHLFALAIEAPALAPIPDAAAPQPVPLRRRMLWLALGGAALVAGAVTAVVVLRTPSGVTAAGGPNTVVRVDPEQAKVVNAVGVASGPVLLAGEGSTLWIASETARTLTKLDINSGASTPVGLDGVPTGIAVSGDTVYVAQAFDHSIERFAAATGTAAGPLEDFVVRRIVFDDSDGWGIDPVADAVVHFSPGRDPDIIRLPAGGVAADITVGAEAVWVANSVGGTVTRIEPDTSKTASVRVIDPPTAVATTDSAVWVASEIRDSLVRIDPSSNQPAARVEVCDAPIDLAALANDIWVACAGSHELMRVGADGADLGRIPLPAVPSSIVVLNQSIWVTLRVA
jgi:class 3 adenylate cyclase